VKQELLEEATQIKSEAIRLHRNFHFGDTFTPLDWFIEIQYLKQKQKKFFSQLDCEEKKKEKKCKMLISNVMRLNYYKNLARSTDFYGEFRPFLEKINL
jgi:hypothetical protein